MKADDGVAPVVAVALTSAKDKDQANIITRFVMKESGDEDIWRTGELLTFVGDNVLKTLSIVGLDSRNRPAVLWMGADAIVLPVGDMVPDEWGEQSGGGDEPQLPNPPFDDIDPTGTT